MKKLLAALAALLLWAPAALGQVIISGGGGFPQGAWTTYAPSPSCSGGTFTVNSAQYQTVGKTTFVAMNLTVATGPCASSSSNLAIALPNTAAASGGSAATFEYGGGAFIYCSIPDSAPTTLQCRSNINLVATSRFSLSLVYQNQ